MVLEVFPTDEVLLPFSYIKLYSINISGILRHISQCYFIFLTTSNFFWLDQAFSIVLNILHLLVHDFYIGFVFEFSSCHIYHSIVFLCLTLIFFEFLLYFLFFSTFFFRFPLIICFLLPSGFLWTLLLLLP